MTAIGLLPGALRVVLVGGFASSARSRVAVARSFDLGEAQGASLGGFRYLRFREFRVDLRISASGLRGFRFEALKLLHRRHATAKI